METEPAIIGEYTAGARGWSTLLVYFDGSRELLRVTPEREVTIADDLTLEEAKQMLTEMARRIVMTQRDVT